MPKTAIFKKVSKMTDLNIEIWKLNKMIAKDPYNMEALRELATIYHYLGENRIAIKIYEKIAEMDSSDSSVRAFLGYLFYEMGDMDLALAQFNISLDLNPKDSFVYFLLGNAYSRLGKIKDAVKSYDMAILLGLDVYRAHLDFASKYEDMGRKYKALIEYKSAYELEPTNRSLVSKIRNLEGEIGTALYG